MKSMITKQMQGLFSTLGLDEEPMGLVYTREKPADCFSPKSKDLPTREKEEKNQVDWPALFSDFSCVMGHIWRARRKKKPACFSARCFGCAGGAFWLGFLKPMPKTIIHYVSTGIPGVMEGELYCQSPEDLRRVVETVDLVPAPEPYCVVQPLSLFGAGQSPDLVIFFARPESLCGLHQLAFFVTSNPEVVASPFSAGCGSIAGWPYLFSSRGHDRAVVVGWDPSARKYFRGDELSFTVSFKMFERMATLYEKSFLTTHTWSMVIKKIARSKKAWGIPPDNRTP